MQKIASKCRNEAKIDDRTAIMLNRAIGKAISRQGRRVRYIKVRQTMNGEVYTFTDLFAITGTGEACRGIGTALCEPSFMPCVLPDSGAVVPLVRPQGGGGIDHLAKVQQKKAQTQTSLSPTPPGVLTTSFVEFAPYFPQAWGYLPPF